MSTGFERPHADPLHEPDDTGLVRIVLDGDLDARSVQDLRNDLDAVLHDARVTTVHIDLRLVRFLDSSGLGALVSARMHADVTDTRLVLSNPGSQVRRLMTLTGTYEAFTWA